MLTAHPVEYLFERLQVVEPYPRGVVPVPDRIRGVAFFPGGSGLWLTQPGSHLPTMPINGIMVLGHNFDNVAGFERSLANEGENLKGATWRNLLDLLDRAEIQREQCFFTNAYMGLIDGPSAVGVFPGAKDEDFVGRCRRFLLEQINIMQPRLILTLGKEVVRFLAALSPDMQRAWDGARTLEQLDSRDAALIKSATFPGAASPLTVVALTHPALRHANVGRRRYRCLQGDAAEVALLHDAKHAVGMHI